jgi:rare lipoprotein A (peptidoglycan hydrolase)
MKPAHTSSLLLKILCGLILCACGCDCYSDPIASRENTVVDIKTTTVKLAAQKQQTKFARPSEVYAVWYDVPPLSLARRRAGKDELTAAHNRLPLGTLVCVTNIKNGKCAIVRITDRGITNRRAKIDICKEAAEQIGILREGIARVRLEVLPDPPEPIATDPSRAIAH